MSVVLTARGLREGVRTILPLAPAVSLFGVAVGASAAQKGLTLAELSVMNAIVYAGSSQLVALGLWQERWTFAGLISITLVVFVVNARLILMGASLRPWLGQLPPSRSYASLFFLTDANWIAGQSYHGEGGRDAGLFLGAGLLLWVVWMIAPVAGYLVGNLVANPRSVGIDLIMPVFFTAMVVRLWKSHADTLPWVAAGMAGLIGERFLSNGLHVILGALLGMGIAAAMAGRAPPPSGSVGPEARV